MQSLTEELIARLNRPFFSRTELDVWIKGSVYRRDGMLRRAMAVGEVMRVRRGLYLFCPPYQKQKPDPMGLAQQIYGPSYISMESAECVALLEEKINATDWNRVRADVERFVKSGEQPSLKLWSAGLFLAQSRKLIV